MVPLSLACIQYGLMYAGLQNVALAVPAEEVFNESPALWIIGYVLHRLRVPGAGSLRRDTLGVELVGDHPARKPWLFPHSVHMTADSCLYNLANGVDLE